MTLVAPTRLGRLLGFLEQDNDNLDLLAEAASAALDAHEPAIALSLVERHERLAPPSASLRNLAGVAAMSSGEFSRAAGWLAPLRAEGEDDPALGFNLAWCRAMEGSWGEVALLLDETALAAVPAAAALKVQALHHLGHLDEALRLGERLAPERADDKALFGALAAAALDAEAFEAAGRYAARSDDTALGLGAQGMLQLDEGQYETADDLFRRALAMSPNDGRALLGLGLTLLAKGDATAASWLDRAARTFGGHLGSWVAAAWAHLALEDVAASRARFETAVAIDATFAEAQGGLAVLDVLEGRLESAERLSQTALRLDRDCFAGALAQILLADHRGDTRTAERIRSTALNAPAGPNGRTILQTLPRMATRRR